MAARAGVGGRVGATVLALIASAQFVVLLEAWVMNLALPSIAADLELGDSELAWVANAYMLVLGGCLLLGGRLADVAGPRLLFGAGLLTFAAGSLIGGMATNAAWLIAGRAVQGLGGALVSPAALALLLRLHAPGPERTSALGVWGAMAALGAPTGALAGGVLTDALGWQAVLLANVPVCLAAALAGCLLLPALPPERPGAGVDLAGALLSMAAAALLLTSLTGLGERGWPVVVALLAAALLLCALFVAVEATVADPLVPLAFLRSRAVATPNAVASTLQVSQYGAFLALSICLQQVVGLSPFGAGLAFVPYGLAVMPAAAATARLVTRFGAPATISLGLGTLAAGLGWLTAALSLSQAVVALLPGMMLLGFGGGTAWAAVNAVALHEVGGEVAGLAGGLLNSSQLLGSAVGVAVALGLNGAVLPELGAVGAMQATFCALALGALATACLAHRLLTPQRGAKARTSRVNL